MTQSRGVLTKSAENIFNAKSRVSGAKVGGIYMEGPYFSMKYKGGQNPEFIRCPDIDEFNTINAISHGLIKIVSIAPEVEGAEEFIRSVCPTVKVAAGHTDADYDTMLRAIEWGVGQLTHTFNTMRPLHHREPNAIGAALDGSVMCECIADGIHVHPVMVRLLYKAVGGERLVLVSDSVRPAGLTDGQYTSGGLKVFVKHGRIILENGDIAGGSTPLFECMKRAISFGVPIEDAVRAATYNPAKSAGIDEEVGTIKNGRAADFLLVDSDLNLKAVYIDGKKVY
jgi:N-acetylglucosamine-6-phosphate deacetylase